MGPPTPCYVPTVRKRNEVHSAPTFRLDRYFFHALTYRRDRRIRPTGGAAAQEENAVYDIPGIGEGVAPRGQIELDSGNAVRDESYTRNRKIASDSVHLCTPIWTRCQLYRIPTTGIDILIEVGQEQENYE